MSDFSAARRLAFKRILARYSAAGVSSEEIARIVNALAPGGTDEDELIRSLDAVAPEPLLKDRSLVDVRELMVQT